MRKFLIDIHFLEASMLSLFSVSGFRSFKDKAEISFRSEAITENQDTISNGGYLPAVVILGPNGSGKSSMLKALQNLVEFISLPLLSSGDVIKGLDKGSFSLLYWADSSASCC